MTDGERFCELGDGAVPQSRCGDEMMQVPMLYEAAQSMLYSKKWSWLKAWAMQIARRRGIEKGDHWRWRVRLAVDHAHRIWVDGTEFRWTRRQTGGSSMKTLQDQIQ